MKAISLWQPWASLWASGAKIHETRSWKTTYQGPIAIHAASKNINSVLKEVFPCGDYEYHPSHFAKLSFLEALRAAGIDQNNLPYGCIIAIAELSGCTKMTDHFIANQSPKELKFGNWTVGRYAWSIINIRILDKPIPAKGHQGLWNWEAQDET